VTIVVFADSDNKTNEKTVHKLSATVGELLPLSQLLYTLGILTIS
jgi:hypothetical protein